MKVKRAATSLFLQLCKPRVSKALSARARGLMTRGHPWSALAWLSQVRGEVRLHCVRSCGETALGCRGSRSLGAEGFGGVPWEAVGVESDPLEVSGDPQPVVVGGRSEFFFFFFQ